MYGFEHGSMGWGWPGVMLIWRIASALVIGHLRFFARWPGPKERARYASATIERDEDSKRRHDLRQ